MHSKQIDTEFVSFVLELVFSIKTTAHDAFSKKTQTTPFYKTKIFSFCVTVTRKQDSKNK